LLEQLAYGRGQKQNVSFPDESAFVGQRLVLGLAIAPAWARWKTTLRVEDPSPERDLEHYTVTPNNLEVLSLNQRSLRILAIAEDSKTGK